MAIRANNTYRHNLTLIVVILLTTILVTGIYTTNVPIVFADSRILKQDTTQNASCATGGADSTVSDSCNLQSINNVNNGVPKTTGIPTTGTGTGTGTGTLLVNVFCIGSGCPTGRLLNMMIITDYP